jgi:hypothetical protein
VALADELGVLDAEADGVADALAFADAEADADALPLGVADLLALGLGDADAWLVSCTELTTWRNRNRAVSPTCLIASLFWPATDTTIWLLPCVTTSGSDTPRPLTRFSMICRASSRFAADGVLPPGSLAINVSVVPPTRSRPSFGFSRPCQCDRVPGPVKKTNAYNTTKIAASTMRYRDGCIRP